MEKNIKVEEARCELTLQVNQDITQPSRCPVVKGKKTTERALDKPKNPETHKLLAHDKTSNHGRAQLTATKMHR
jgi:hypothetical protein